jgi:hypothetical protein
MIRRTWPASSFSSSRRRIPKGVKKEKEKVSVPAIVEKGYPGKQFANVCRQPICERVMRVEVLEK